MPSTPRPGLTRSAALIAILIFATRPLSAGSPYDGWRGESYAAPSYAYGSNQRPMDGSYRSSPAALPPAAWSGLYLGFNAAGGFGDVEAAGFDHDSFSYNGWLLGAHAGYALQTGNLVAALEADIAWSNLSEDATAAGASLTASSDWLTSARMRLGYAADSYLIYLTGGLALSDFDLTLSDAAGGGSDSAILGGYVIGAGVEMKLTPGASVRFEALHYGFGEDRLTPGISGLDTETDFTTVRAGVSFGLN